MQQRQRSGLRRAQRLNRAGRCLDDTRARIGEQGEQLRDCAGRVHAAQGLAGQRTHHRVRVVQARDHLGLEGRARDDRQEQLAARAVSAVQRVAQVLVRVATQALQGNGSRRADGALRIEQRAETRGRRGTADRAEHRRDGDLLVGRGQREASGQARHRGRSDVCLAQRGFGRIGAAVAIDVACVQIGQRDGGHTHHRFAGFRQQRGQRCDGDRLSRSTERAGDLGLVARALRQGREQGNRPRVAAPPQHVDGGKHAKEISALRRDRERVDRLRTSDVPQAFDRCDGDVVIDVCRERCQHITGPSVAPAAQHLRCVGDDGRVGVGGERRDLFQDVGRAGHERVDCSRDARLAVTLRAQHGAERPRCERAGGGQRANHLTPNGPARVGQHREERIDAGGACRGQPLDVGDAIALGRAQHDGRRAKGHALRAGGGRSALRSSS